MILHVGHSSYHPSAPYPQQAGYPGNTGTYLFKLSNIQQLWKYLSLFNLLQI